MLFNSLEFLLFFFVVVGLYFGLPHRVRWVLLLGASYLFYMAWNPWYALLILTSTGVDFFAGLRMGAADSRRGRLPWLVLSLLVNLGLLFAFKYFAFAMDSASALFAWLGNPIEVPHLNVLLPVGISFYTFQTLSYTIEVYRGRQEPVRHAGHFGLYVSFFPQLVAGPIERPQRLLPQLVAKHDFDYARVVSGLRQALWGMFKKVVIADRLAVIVDAVYMEPERYPGSILVLATVCFAFQIYCDFSGYSDIAIGTARVMGFELMENFRRPYFARSIAEFWRRWHISLSTWFGDYVYKPLGGSRGTTRAWVIALLATFGLSGLWHGASWTFVIWGMLHVAYYLAGYGIAKALRRGDTSVNRVSLNILGTMATFSAVCFGWIFFRAENLGDAWYIVTHLGDRFGDFSANGGFGEIVRSWDISMRAFQLNVLLIIGLLVAEAWSGDDGVAARIGRWPMPLRWATYAVLTLAMMNFGITQEIPFVYFQF